MFEIQILKNENILEGWLDSPNAALEEACLNRNLVANAGEGWESNWAAKIPTSDLQRSGPSFNKRLLWHWGQGARLGIHVLI